jgi:transposase InsO family protein
MSPSRRIRASRLDTLLRFCWIDAEEFYRMLDHGIVIDDANVFNDKLQEWEDFYNFHRPHGGLDGQTPYERLRQKTTTRTRA